MPILSCWLFSFIMIKQFHFHPLLSWERGIKKGANPFSLSTYFLRRCLVIPKIQISGKESAPTCKLFANLFPYLVSFTRLYRRGNKSVSSMY